MGGCYRAVQISNSVDGSFPAVNGRSVRRFEDDEESHHIASHSQNPSIDEPHQEGDQEVTLFSEVPQLFFITGSAWAGLGTPGSRSFWAVLHTREAGTV